MRHSPWWCSRSIGLWTHCSPRFLAREYVATHISANNGERVTSSRHSGAVSGIDAVLGADLSMYGTIAIATSRARNRELVPWATGTLAASSCSSSRRPASGEPVHRASTSSRSDARDEPAASESWHGAASRRISTSATWQRPFRSRSRIAALFSRKLDAEWLSVVRRWAVAVVVFLTIGIGSACGGRSVELGWSGYWHGIRSRIRASFRGSRRPRSCIDHDSGKARDAAQVERPSW